MPFNASGRAAQAGLDGAIDNVVKLYGGTVVSRSMTTYLDQPAEDANVSASVGGIHARVVFVGRRFYVLYGITATANDPHPGYDRLIATFQTV